MKRRIQSVLEQIIESVGRWKGVDTLTLMNYEDDIYDPYFFLSLDLYYHGSIPSVEERAADFSFAGGFESSGINRKDRFLVGEVPVRIEYKDIQRFNSIISDSLNNSAVLRDSGTYMFHRIMESEVIINESKWIDEIRRNLGILSDEFWYGLRKSAESRMEHYLSDLSAAVLREDDLFFMISSSGFIKSACRCLFAVNHEFEPPPRQLFDKVGSLDVMPDVFQGLFESFIRHQDTSLSRKREVAELLAKKIIQL